MILIKNCVTNSNVKRGSTLQGISNLNEEWRHGLYHNCKFYKLIRIKNGNMIRFILRIVQTFRYFDDVTIRQYAITNLPKYFSIIWNYRNVLLKWIMKHVELKEPKFQNSQWIIWSDCVTGKIVFYIKNYYCKSIKYVWQKLKIEIFLFNL